MRFTMGEVQLTIIKASEAESRVETAFMGENINVIRLRGVRSCSRGAVMREITGRKALAERWLIGIALIVLSGCDCTVRLSLAKKIFIKITFPSLAFGGE